jgi:FAD reductase [NAD(P)H]
MTRWYLTKSTEMEMDTLKLLGISGTIIGSKTLAVVEKVIELARQYDPQIETEILDLKKLDVQFCDGRHPDTYEGDTRKVIEMISAADSYIIGTPIFQASLSGALKNLFDLVPPSAFRNKVIGFIATGGTYQHYLVIENQLKPIAGYFRAYTAPNYVYLHTDHFNSNNEIIDTDVLLRLENLAKEVVHMSKVLTPLVKL